VAVQQALLLSGDRDRCVACFSGVINIHGGGGKDINVKVEAPKVEAPAAPVKPAAPAPAPPNGGLMVRGYRRRL